MKEHLPAEVQAAPLTPQDMRDNVNLIQSVMKEVMSEGEHYGTIPGTKKDTLYKAGAEKLIMTFRLAPKVQKEEIVDLGNDHRECRLTVALLGSSGNFLGEAVGTCSTKEGKYRFRTGAKKVTDKPVPPSYWNLRKKDPAKAQALIGKGNSTKKVDGNWFITEGGGDKVEHDNPADYWNTVSKMAYKRALVAVTLVVTGASDIFTQDIEDMPEVIPQPESAAPQGASEQPQQEEIKPEPEQETGPPPDQAPPPEAEPELDDHDALHRALLIYCGMDKDLMKEELEKLTTFQGSDGSDIFMHLTSLVSKKVKPAWCKKTLTKLRKKAEKDGMLKEMPEGCTKQSMCPEQGSDGETAVCSITNMRCPYAFGLEPF
jgi:hypothetical protein